MGCLLLPFSSLETSLASAWDRASPLIIANSPSGHTGERSTLRMASLCRIGLHGISRQERCHPAALSPISEPSGRRRVGWATMGSSGCADAHSIAGGTDGDEAEQ